MIAIPLYPPQERDVMPNGNQVHALNLEYPFKMEEKVPPRLPTRPGTTAARGHSPPRELG